MIKKLNMGLMRFFTFLVFASLFFVIGCEKEEPEDDNNNNNNNNTQNSTAERLNKEIYETMEEIYLWNDSLVSADPADFDNPSDFLRAIRYQDIDKWSYILSTSDFNQYFQQGEYKGHGILITVDSEENLRIGFVYKSTQVYEKGVRRSWIIKKINGTDATVDNFNELLGPSDEAVTNKILFLDSEGNEKELDLTKETVKITSVLHSEVIDYKSKKVGYIVFSEFISTSNEELKVAFEEFASESIDELIIDLRYNGGGMNSVAEYFASWIAGNRSNSIYYKLVHNSENQFRNITVKFPANSSALDLSKVHFITTNSSASASELLINGLKPYYDVKVIGSNTSGKPVGMYAIDITRYNYTLVPISFKYVNSNDEGDFYDGLPADYAADDDITRDFGDIEENSLKVALSVIAGETILKSATEPAETRILAPSTTGIHQFLRAY